MKAAKRRRVLAAAGLMADGVLAGLRARGVPPELAPEREALVAAAWPLAVPWAEAAYRWQREESRAQGWVSRQVTRAAARAEPSLADFTVGEAELSQAVAAGGCRRLVREAA